MKCVWCKRKINGWFLKYKGNCFCRDYNDKCLKEYLFKEADDLITMDKLDGSDEYDMSEVDDGI